jgi:hypothetical protein
VDDNLLVQAMHAIDEMDAARMKVSIQGQHLSNQHFVLQMAQDVEGLAYCP